MQPYKNSKNGGITAFEIGDCYIIAVFHDGTQYLYTYESAGKDNIQQMKRLAIAGSGLTTFINQKVKYQFAIKQP